MSLMLDALKRIEAKRASARPAASASVAIEPPHVAFPDFRGPALEPHYEPLGEIELAESMGAVAVAAPPAPEPIELPRELTASDAADLTPEEVALPGDVSLERAVDELSDLLAEARQLDQPPPTHEPANLAPPKEDLDRACMSGLGGDLEGPPVVAPQQGSDAIASGEFTIELSEPAARPKCLSRRPALRVRKRCRGTTCRLLPRTTASINASRTTTMSTSPADMNIGSDTRWAR